MRKKNELGLLGKAAIMSMALGMLGAGTAPVVNATAPQTTQQQSRKDAVQVKHTPVRPVSKINDLFGSGDANPYKHNRRGVLNQRQWRKWLRSNPHMRNSKKSK